MPLGLPIVLRDFIKFNRGLVNFSADDHLCFFRCLAMFQGTDTRYCEKAAKQLFLEYITIFFVFPSLLEYSYFIYQNWKIFTKLILLLTN